MDLTTQMKLLLEAVKAPEVDQPKATYANTPGEQTLDSATQQNFGTDLHKKKPAQYKQKAGDNPRADKTDLEEALTRKFEKFKLTESAGSDETWSSEAELFDWIDHTLAAGPLQSLVAPGDVESAVDDIMAGDVEGAVDTLMREYTDHNGGRMRNHRAVENELRDSLEAIANARADVALETAGDSTGESPTLKQLHQKGVDQLDGVKAKVFGPTDAYPAPWTAQHVGGKYPIYAIKAANRAEVATWMNRTQAEKVISEIS